MSVTPPPAATAPESATTALYRAALGPVNTAYYLERFERFDEAGRASPAWNWAAGWLTLNWLVFRQVWLAALVYVACAEGMALLVLGLGRTILQWPQAVEWGVLGALLVLCIAIPGAYGNAWLHAEIRRRMTRAVREARTVREACAALERQASTPRRLWVLVGLNLVVVSALVAGYLALSAVVPGAPPTIASPEAATPAAPAPEPQPVFVPPASAPTPASAASEPSLEPVVVDTAPVAPAPASLPEPVEPPPPEPAVKAVAREPQAPAPILAPRPAAPSAGSSAQEFAVNVGLFADPENAEKAHARLIEAGVPAFTQTLEMPNGTRIRVRAGPFRGRVQAEAAAERIRALGLEAQIYAQ